MKKLYFVFCIVGIYFDASAQLEYKDVAGIFYSRCTPCHHTNGGAPFSMMNYTETAPWSSLIEVDLLSGKMPPWPPDTTYTRFLHERVITSSEKNAILSWINSGSLKGDTTLSPPAPVYNKYKLKGTPDLILKIPTFASNGGASDAYNCFSIPTGLTQDRIVRAFEVIPGNPDIVHHIVVKVDTTGTVTSDLSGNCFTEPGDFTLDVYAPGGAPTVYPGQAPLKMGVRLKAGSNVIMQIHYPPGTAGQLDSTQMRIYFYPPGATGIRNVITSTPLTNWFMSIQANTVDTFTAWYPPIGALWFPVSVFGAFPHSHLLCTSIVNYADNGTSTIPLIRINKWNFAWQGFYFYKNLVKVPAGYVVRSSHVFDNTTNNPNNPNSPPQQVNAGEGTKDEMLFDSFQYLVYQPGDENIDLASLLLNDTLLNPPTAINEFAPMHLSSYVYPNPFTEYISIGYALGAPASTTVFIYNIFGSEVTRLSSSHETVGLHSVTWNGKNSSGDKVPAGIYFYTLRAGKATDSGKIILMPE